MEEKKFVEILGHKVPESQLKQTLKNVIKEKGMEGMLVIGEDISKKERIIPDEIAYKYAFF